MTLIPSSNAGATCDGNFDLGGRVVGGMPILRKESDIFPAHLFDISDETAPWEIVHVRNRQEKALARFLIDRRHPFYLPQIEKQIRRSARTFVSFLALFPGYVFIRRTDDSRQVLWSSGVVVRVIPVADQRLLRSELVQIRSLQESGAVLTPYTDLAPGDQVRVTQGVFNGYIGTVVRERDVTRLVVSISALNKSVVAEFPRESVRAIRRESLRPIGLPHSRACG